MLENVENDKNKSGSAKITRSSTRLENTRLEKDNAVNGGGDGNSKL